MKQQWIDDENNLDNSGEQEDIAEYFHEPHLFVRKIFLHGHALKHACFFQILIFPWPVGFVFVKQNMAGKYNGIHREGLRAKVSIKEMDGKNEPNR